MQIAFQSNFNNIYTAKRINKIGKEITPLPKDSFQLRFSGKKDIVTNKANAISESPDILADMVEHFKMELQTGSSQEKQALKGRLCLHWLQLKKAQREKEADFWNNVAIQVFKKPVTVLAGVGGLNKIIGMSAQKEELEAQIVGPFAQGYDKPDSLLVLHGPPGTGKTFYAQCIADHLGYEFLKVKYSDVAVNGDRNSVFGETAARIRDIFDKAQTKGKTVLLFDEGERFLAIRTPDTKNDASYNTGEFIDCINDLNAFNDVPENYNKRVLAIVALNNISHIDTAAFRPERAYTMEVPPCTVQDKRMILRHEIDEGGYKFSPDIDITKAIDFIISKSVEEKLDLPPSDIKSILKNARNYARYLNSPISEGMPDDTIHSKHLERSLSTVLKTRKQIEAASSSKQ